MCGRFSIPAYTLDSANLQMENIWEKVPQSKIWFTLHFHCVCNYLHCIKYYNLEVISSIQEDVCRCKCANTPSFYIRVLSICRFWYPWRWGLGVGWGGVLEPVNSHSFVSLPKLAIFSQASCLYHRGTIASGFSLIIREARAFPSLWQKIPKNALIELILVLYPEPAGGCVPRTHQEVGGPACIRGLPCGLGTEVWWSVSIRSSWLESGRHTFPKVSVCVGVGPSLLRRQHTECQLCLA